MTEAEQEEEIEKELRMEQYDKAKHDDLCRLARRCGNCKWAKWELTAKGNPRRTVAGKCLYPMPELPPMPDCMIVTEPHRCYVWMDKGADCQTFQPKSKSS